MTGVTRITHRHGFTLIELLVVVTVLSILALVVIPRVMGATMKARESSLRANLVQLRKAINQFQSDVGGYPRDLDQLFLPHDRIPAAIDDEGLPITVPADTYGGPYLRQEGGINGTGIPHNPFADPDVTDVSQHWNYISSPGSEYPVGAVISAVTGETLEDNTEYTKL